MNLPRFSDKDPADINDYGYDFVPELEGATITNQAVSVSPVGTLVAAAPWATNAGLIGARLSGGDEGVTYTITFTVDLDDGRRLQRSASLLVTAR